MARKKSLITFLLFFGIATVLPMDATNSKLEKAVALGGGFAFGASGLWLIPPLLVPPVMYITDKSRRNKVMKPFLCGVIPGALTFTGIMAKLAYDYLKS